MSRFIRNRSESRGSTHRDNLKTFPVGTEKTWNWSTICPDTDCGGKR